MARRLAALFGFIAVLVLVAALLYRVYIHHTKAEPYEDESVVVVLHVLSGSQNS